MQRAGWDVVGSAAELRALVGEPLPRVRDEVRDRLHPLDVAFLSASPLWVLASASADGRCAASPKGDPAGSEDLAAYYGPSYGTRLYG